MSQWLVAEEGVMSQWLVDEEGVLSRWLVAEEGVSLSCKWLRKEICLSD